MSLILEPKKQMAIIMTIIKAPCIIIPYITSPSSCEDCGHCRSYYTMLHWPFILFTLEISHVIKWRKSHQTRDMITSIIFILLQSNVISPQASLPQEPYYYPDSEIDKNKQYIYCIPKKHLHDVVILQALQDDSLLVQMPDWKHCIEMIFPWEQYVLDNNSNSCSALPNSNANIFSIQSCSIVNKCIKKALFAFASLWSMKKKNFEGATSLIISCFCSCTTRSDEVMIRPSRWVCL